MLSEVHVHDLWHWEELMKIKIVLVLHSEIKTLKWQLTLSKIWNIIAKWKIKSIAGKKNR